MARKRTTQITIRTLLLAIVAAALTFGLFTEVRRRAAATTLWSGRPEIHLYLALDATLWAILPAIAAFALRRWSLDVLMVQVAASAALILFDLGWLSCPFPYKYYHFQISFAGSVLLPLLARRAFLARPRGRDACRRADLVAWVACLAFLSLFLADYHDTLQDLG